MSGSSTGVDASDENFYIGIDANLDDEFNGQIDEVALFDSSIPESQIIDIFNNGISTQTLSNNDSKSIKATFNITTKTGATYLLKTRKTTSGLANLIVHKYLDNNSIASGSVNAVITTGTDSTDITSLFSVGDNATVRLFTDSVQNFSEVQLVESINDY